jgi:Protein of unknown function (DUF2726)
MSTINIWWVVASLALVLVGGWWWSRRGATKSSSQSTEERLDTLAGWPPQAMRVLSVPERMVLNALTRALPEYIVLAQVPIARFIRVPKRNSYVEWLRRLGTQCADIVVCDMSASVIAVIEIQGPLGRISQRSIKRLGRLRRTLKNAGIPLHVWVENALPNASEMRAAILHLAPTTQTSDNSGASKAPPSTPALTPKTATTEKMPAVPSPMMTAEATSGAVDAPTNSPFDDAARDSSNDEFIEMREPPSSTWFDELDSALAPLEVTKPSKLSKSATKK